MKVQIALLIKVAREQLEYSKTIIDHPKKMGRENFDVIYPLDKFYKTICNMSFNDALLITGSLLDKDKRVISLWNCPDFVSMKQKELDKILDDFIKTGLKGIRDQIVAHQDYGNPNNNIPNSRRTGLINIQCVTKLQNILNNIMKEFMDYSAISGNPYSSQYFNIEDARNEINLALDNAQPKLTDSVVI